MVVVGIFELSPLCPGRWRVLNTQTQIGYVTYGTEAEVTQILQEATLAWERLHAKLKKHGGAWRDQMKFQSAKERSSS